MSFEIGELHPNSPHLFADLAELLVLTNHLGRERINSNDIEGLLGSAPVNADESDEEDEQIGLEKSSAEKNTRADRQIEDVFTQLEYRAKAFGEQYPFSVDGQSLSLNPISSAAGSVYFFLLSCSRLRSFKRQGVQQRWARLFAKVSQIGMKALVSTSSIVRIFDANSDDRRDYYGTDLRKAIKVLGKDLALISLNEQECDHLDASGDAGIDLVSVMGFNDGATVHSALFGQCAAQERGWPKKTLEASPVHLRHLFGFQSDPPIAMFTPVCYRNSDGSWVSNSSANGVLLIDRIRLYKLIELQDAFENISASQWFRDYKNEFEAFIRSDLD